MGLLNLKKTLRREAVIKKLHPTNPITYLWFIGVHPNYQGRGLGTQLLTELIQDSLSINRPVYLETSTQENLPWYVKLGFKQYYALDLGYTLYFFKKDNY
ncbi:GNAT family N-acetyltransferase [Adhaeribacter swui]|uniref:GNAT family N-acetyltransferase n=1 Tax=Adhaeribacter swui TaxID=2086471 RepID=UPI001E60AA7E|nr:GNAT family N-acetyltransferase [Adhaeribacter swui]